EEAPDQTINTYQELIEVLEQRIEYFHQHGCRVSDHALDTLRYKEADETVLEEIFQKALANKLLSTDEIDASRTETQIRLTDFY
ncbi:glucuronate isomerase, partial [Enterococcus lactis]|uniref:glucuronate isomerase n=1 Tax=Enterococcus lactis TaxID=357441 RepID=UPI0031CCE9F0